MKRLFSCIIIFTSLSGCFKEEEYNTKLVLRPAMQDVSGADFAPLSECVAYAFVADTTQWEFTSWQDAVEGVMRNKEVYNTTLSPFATAESYEEVGLDEGSMLSMRIAKETALIVVAHTTTENYAWTIYSLGMNVETTYLYVPFRFWKEGEYTQSSWQLYAPDIVEDEDDLTIE